MIHSELFADLGIPIDYGRHPRRPVYAEASELEDVEPNILGRMQRLAPRDRARVATDESSGARGRRRAPARLGLSQRALPSGL